MGSSGTGVIVDFGHMSPLRSSERRSPGSWSKPSAPLREAMVLALRCVAFINLTKYDHRGQLCTAHQPDSLEPR